MLGCCLKAVKYRIGMINYTVLIFFLLVPLFSIQALSEGVSIFTDLDSENTYFDNIYSFGFNNSYDIETCLFTSGATLFSSYNTHSPQGMNDGVLWQGKGYNSSLSVGFLYKHGSWMIALYPEITFSQNLSFDLVDPAAMQESEYGSFLTNIDNPQRYGDSAFFSITTGESEIRYAGEHFTAGLGSQALWLGPGRINSLILSNNAGGFPKLDIGVRDIKTGIGEFEFFGWWGLLKESDYFDSNSNNNHNLFNGLHIDYRPSFVPGLTLGFNRTLISDFAKAGLDSYTSLYIPFMSTLFGQDENDQRASITAEWVFPSVGFTAYTEWARNDYQPSLRSFLQFPQRTQAYTMGLSQRVYEKGDQAVYTHFELSNLLMSWDYTLDDPQRTTPTFYSHHNVKQGYTNNGQILGAGIGSGSNSQTFIVDYYHDDLLVRCTLQRIARSQDYLFSLPVGSEDRDTGNNNVDLVVSSLVRQSLSDNITIKYSISFNRVLNQNYVRENDRNNIHATFTLSYYW